MVINQYKFYYSDSQNRDKIIIEQNKIVQTENLKDTYIKEAEEIKQTRQQAFEKQFDLIEMLKPEELELTFEEKQNKLVDDYTISQTIFKFNKKKLGGNFLSNQKFENDKGLTLNTDSELQLKDNPLAMKVLSEGAIDLRDKRINIGSMNISDSDIIQSDQKLHEIDLGKVVSNKKDSILLEDIDVFNIPEDKNIILEKNEKKLHAIGIRVKKEKIHDGEEFSNEQEKKQNKQNSEGFSVAVSKNIFEEKDFKEHADETLFETEKELLFYDWNQAFRVVLSFVPVWFVIYFFVQSCLELYATKHDIFLMEEQELDIYNRTKKQYQQQILLQDPRFNRKYLLQLSTQHNK